MTFNEAKTRQPDDIVRAFDPSIKTTGNFLVKEITVDGKNIYFLLDNGLTYKHTQVDQPAICSSENDIYCSWYGWTNSIRKTGITALQSLRMSNFHAKCLNNFSEKDIEEEELYLKSFT